VRGPAAATPLLRGRRLPGLLAAALVLTSLAGCAARRPASDDVVLRSRLSALFADLHARGLFSGAAIVGRGGEVVFEGGWGLANVETATPFTVDTPTDGASLAKTFTAALTLQLAEEGRLDLDAPAQRLLPELPYADVTLRHLLSHSASLPDYTWFDPFLGVQEVRTTERLLAIVGEQRPPPAFAPGTAYEYSSFGFDLVALAASRAAGKDLGALFAERFFGPLGMTSAFLRPGRLADFPPPRTIGYRRVGAALVPHEVFDLEGFHGGSNVYLSVRDLHRWNASFLDRPSLARAPLSAALTPATVGAGTSGLTLGSWYRSPDAGAFWYSGHLQGFHSEVFRDTASNSSIVYTSNDTIPTWLQKAIVRAARTILAGSAAATPVAPAVSELRDGEHPDLAGAWQLTDGAELFLEWSAGALRVAADGVLYRAVPVAPDCFYVPGLDLVLGFGRDGEATPGRIHVASSLGERWGIRKRR
jgi:CubicO group peptidase (beta-lactamase class C family)